MWIAIVELGDNGEDRDSIVVGCYDDRSTAVSEGEKYLDAYDGYRWWGRLEITETDQDGKAISPSQEVEDSFRRWKISSNESI